MLNLRGHSRFKTELIELGGKKFVKKTAPNWDLYQRLRNQIERQSLAREIYPNFIAPMINELNESERSVTMEYIDHLSPIQYLCERTLERRNWFYGEIIDYLNHLIDKCEVHDFDIARFQVKLLSTFTNIMLEQVENADLMSCVRQVTKDLMEKSRQLIGALDYITPVHGDFTLSNLLVKSDQVYWLDFMDGWNHSVMIDMAKIYQEINYCWSHRFLNDRTVSFFAYQDCMLEMKAALDTAFFQSDKDIPLFLAHSALNDLRLLQYEKNTSYSDLIIRKIQETVRCI